jgi:hypothetical protein
MIKNQLIIFGIAVVLIAVGLSGCNEQTLKEEVAPIINSFTATPAIIAYGNETVLNWSVTGAKGVSLNKGIGTVNLSGSYTLKPKQNQTYILTAYNSYGTSNTSVFITVIPEPHEEYNNQTVYSIKELWQKKDNLVGKNVTVQGYYNLSVDGPRLLPDTTDSEPNPTIWIWLDNTSFNSTIQSEGITVSSNLKYYAIGVLEKVTISIGYDIKIIVKSIIAV